jgi:hypothetical protein
MPDRPFVAASSGQCSADSLEHGAHQWRLAHSSLVRHWIASLAGHQASEPVTPYLTPDGSRSATSKARTNRSAPPREPQMGGVRKRWALGRRARSAKLVRTCRRIRSADWTVLRIRKQQVLGSNPSVGSTPLLSRSGRPVSGGSTVLGGVGLGRQVRRGARGASILGARRHVDDRAFHRARRLIRSLAERLSAERMPPTYLDAAGDEFAMALDRWVVRLAAWLRAHARVSSTG